MSGYELSAEWWDNLSFQDRDTALTQLEYWEGELDYGWERDDIEEDYENLNDIAQDDIYRAYIRSQEDDL